jgi:hypothetical protein
MDFVHGKINTLPVEFAEFSLAVPLQRSAGVFAFMEFI